KVDSTIRGHLRAEIQALSSSWSPNATIVVCPAFPAAGRTVTRGELRVDEVPVSETAAGSDPVNPVRTNHLPALVQVDRIEKKSDESIDSLASRIRRAHPIAVSDA